MIEWKEQLIVMLIHVFVMYRKDFYEQSTKDLWWCMNGMGLFQTLRAT